MDFASFKDRLSAVCPDLTLLENEPMSRHTSFRIGGPVRLMAQVGTVEQFAAALRCAAEFGIVPFVLGNGTNLLAADGQIRRFVIHTGGLTELRLEGANDVVCAAGVPMAQMVRFAVEQGHLGGVEFAHGIPGTMGGGVVMNAGAYGGELKDVVVSSTYLTLAGEAGELVGEEQAFSYRHSAYSAGDRFVTSARLRLPQGDPDVSREKLAEFARKRRSSQPLEYPSGGSTFKRPVGGYAAALIDQCGLKGLTVGGAQVSAKHAGFVINVGGATCRDVLTLTDQIRDTVLRETGIELELEIRRLD